MRIAIISDIHGNRIAFETVLADLRQTSPDLVFHGGDLADYGSSPVEIVDHVRDLGWQGVAGNGEEALATPETLDEFAGQSSLPQSMWDMVREMTAATRSMLGEERIGWRGGLPHVQIHEPVALVHASPESTWRSPGVAASDAELETVYAPLGQSIIVYGHIHCPFIRRLSDGLIVANSGSVSLSYDGDLRAAYLLLDGPEVTIRRVEYDVEEEIGALAACGFPHSDWIAKILRAGSPQMP